MFNEKRTREDFFNAYNFLPNKFLVRVADRIESQYNNVAGAFFVAECAYDNMETYNPKYGETEDQYLMNSIESALDCLPADF